ncbi:DnaJ superfamily protein [Staphylococcus phage APTC_SA_12]|nr:MAG: hypothetical protein [Staphylococcus phage RP2]UPO38702.1 hypothetical protein [Staphylococcus phage vB_SaS_GE1]UWV19899.1 DnaJ superfamily protein [Staphylococcus phage APTC_SA_2]UWV20227.1 DnaJ superfamily protein [Staphylococcus phage APTC_SA_4]UWV20402.1 DnaJ superfamily protein [Staphylococcus phage APTC_SA_12]UWV20721.1 DnaJ superfamily protein [Staphylococcus phage APTC_SA_13]WDQ44180.1 hypothetical protein ESA2_CDS184 [Staphylococcus phage ESa2]WMT38601.1 hypothetical protein
MPSLCYIIIENSIIKHREGFFLCLIECFKIDY